MLRLIQELESDSPDRTRAAGAEFAQRLQINDVVEIIGELGAGKTTLVQGVCRGLGYAGVALSPSFVHIRTYQGRWPIYHVDLYLSETTAAVADLGLDELFTSGGVTLVEWSDKHPELAADAAWRIKIEWPPGQSASIRKIQIFARS